MLSQKQNKGWQSGSSGKAPASKPKALNSIPSISHTHKTNKQMNKKKKAKPLRAGNALYYYYYYYY
jgi:hypothetical protein